MGLESNAKENSGFIHAADSSDAGDYMTIVGVMVRNPHIGPNATRLQVANRQRKGQTSKSRLSPLLDIQDE